MLSIYVNIKNRRLELGLSQTELALKLGYKDKTMISKIEAGRVDLPYSKVLAFAKVLEMDPRDLIGLDGTIEGDK